MRWFKDYIALFLLAFCILQESLANPILSGNFWALLFMQQFEPMDHNIIVLTDAQFDEAISQHQLVLVDFWAPWCGPCLKLAPVIEQIAELYTGKACIAKLNISENSQIPARYCISTIPTMLLFHQGKQVDRLVGNLPITQIQALLDKYLP